MNCPYLVFFDHFSIEEQTKRRETNLNYVKFSSCVEISEIRIVPFGCVVESSISDEAIIGATNPASFNVKIFGYGQNNSPTLQLIAEHHYNESSGMGVIKLNPPVPTSLLLLRGNYDTITLGVFGLPFFTPLPQSSLPTPDFSVPPPLLNNPQSNAPTCPANLPLAPSLSGSFRGVSNQLLPPALPSTGGLHPPTEPPRWSVPPSAITSSPGQQSFDAHLPITSTSATSTSVTPNVGSSTNEAESKTDSTGEPVCSKAPTDLGTLFEDGEIRDFEYESISSNEDPFSESEEHEATSISAKNFALVEQSDPRLGKWKFDPYSFVDAAPETLPATARLRLPDPSLTLFETYCWLLLKPTPTASEKLEAETTVTTAGGDNVPDDLAPPFTDALQAKLDADFLLNVSDQFGIDVNNFNSDWVLTMEKLVDIIPSGLAYLSLNEAEAYEFVITCLVVWTYAGLDLDSALTQSDSTFILRHLRAGIELAGVILSTTSEDVCKNFLQSKADTPEQAAGGGHIPSSFQALHALLDLLESPLMSGPLRVAVVEALDRSTRLPIGLDAFFGRKTSPEETDRKIKMEVEMKEAGATKMESSDDADHDGGGGDDAKALFEQPHNLTPYQRLVLFMSTNKSTHAAVACQRLLTKLHVYELLLEFDEFCVGLHTLPNNISTADALTLESSLQSFLNELTNILQTANTGLANPGKKLKNVLVRVDNSRSGNDAYAALCRLLLSSHFFNHLVWLLEAGFAVVYKPKPESESEVPMHFILAACLPTALRCLQKLINTPSTLLLIASNTDLTSNLLKLLLGTDSSGLLEPALLAKRELIGLELATKLEALHWVDHLIDITRQKGVAGLQAYIHDRLTEETSQAEGTQRDGLYDALFGLARLFVSTCSTRCQKDKIAPPISLASWTAQVVAGEEYFLPCLMLLEAFHSYHASPSTDNANTVNVSDARDGDQGKAAGGSLLDTPGKSAEAAPPTTGRRGGQRRTFLSRLGLSAELDLPTLLTTVCMGVVRYAEDVNYLEHFGPRLLQFLPPTSWEDSLTSLTPAVVFSHLRRFSDAAACWFYWLREAPPAVFYTDISSSSEEAFGWLADQLQSLCEDLDKSLDSAVSQNLTEDLLGTAESTAAAPVALHSLPPAVLLLLRFLKGHMRLPSSSADPQPPPQPVPEVIPKSLPALTTQLLVIELYSRNGLSLLSSLVERISDYLVVVSDAFCEPTTPPSDIDLLVEILVLAVEVLGALLTTLKKVVGGEFHDTTPVAGLCKAFAAVVYLDQSLRSPYLISRLQSGVLNALSAYAILGQGEVSLEGSSKTLWCKVCREIFSFTVSSPEFFLPGLKLLIDLLPLPLPFETLFEPPPSDLKNLQASRIWWCRLLLRLPVELCGLLELLSPSPRSGPVFLTLRSLVDRVANLGPPIASMLASSTVDIILDLFSSAQLPDKTKEQTAAPREDSSGDTINDSAQAASGAGSVVNELSTPGCLLTAGAKLVLGTPSTPPTHESGHTSPSPAAAVVETSVMHHSTAPQTTEDWQAHSRPFSDICEPSDIGRALCLLFVILNQSECKQAFLDLLRESSQPTSNSGGSSNPSRGSRLLSVFANILESCTESKAHITTQSLLIDCIDALLDHKLGVPPVLPSSASADEIQNWECANHLPNTQFLDSLTGLLLVYLDHPDRDLNSLPNVLQILQRLCSHDHGFTLLQKHLSSPKHSLVFANLIGRVNDSFSAENPYYRATLAHLLMLFSTLLDDTVFAEEAAAAVASLSDTKGARPSSPFRDHISVGSADDVALSPTGSSSCKLLRRCHLCGAQLRQLLHRTGQEPNPVRDLSSLLELLAADDPSLKPLHTGMKGLVQILTESESKGSDEELLSGFAETQVISLPEPLPLAELLSQRPVFHLLFGDQQSCDLSSLWHSRSSACQKVQDTPVLATAKDFAKDLKSVNLFDISSEFCPGLDLREELTIRFGRRHADDPGTTMRHQKRRKGQPSIIQTGRNTKYVAPMRGRGFNIRGAGGGGSGPSLLGSGVCGGGGGGGGTPSLLGSGHRPDIFRSRPQNTSRPPSLHVDDFNKLEKDDNASERNYGREESARFRLFRDGRPGRGRGGSGGGAGSLLSGAPLSGVGNLNPYRQPARVLSTLPFVGAALAPTVSAAGPGGGILPAAAMATFLNWAGKPMNISGIPTTAASYRSRHTGLLPPRNN